jgi:very-short-patch-repair endonuclease
MRRKAPLRMQASLENRLWARLREMQGCRFRRKSPFRIFLLDFVEHDAGLVVCLEEGEPGRRSGNIVRDRLLNEQGYVILRLWRREVERDIPGAVQRIKMVLEDLRSVSSPASGGAAREGDPGPAVG